jgi:hypothetical protein
MPWSTYRGFPAYQDIHHWENQIMTQAQQYNVPQSLIDQEGTGEDTKGYIGRKVRFIADPLADAPEFLKSLLGLPDTSNIVGAEGVIVHIAESGDIFADFGDDERVPANPGGDRIVGIDDPNDYDEDEGPIVEFVTE